MKTLPFLILLLLIGCGKDPFFKGDSGTFIDSRDQREYKWVRIGTQTWMAENLAYLPAVSPSTDESETSAFYYVYDYVGNSINDAKSNDNYTLYGVLYNWEAAKIACPSGWHLPTDAEWTNLIHHLGVLPGIVMKSTTMWSENGNGDNSSGFNALPGGTRHIDGAFHALGYFADFWSSKKYDASRAWIRALGYDNDDVYRYSDERRNANSVRCLRN